MALIVESKLADVLGWIDFEGEGGLRVLKVDGVGIVGDSVVVMDAKVCLNCGGGNDAGFIV